MNRGAPLGSLALRTWGTFAAFLCAPILAACSLDTAQLTSNLKPAVDGGIPVRSDDGGTAFAFTRVITTDPVVGARGVLLTLVASGIREGATVDFFGATYSLSVDDDAFTVGPLDLPSSAGDFPVALSNPGNERITRYLRVHNPQPIVTSVEASSVAFGDSSTLTVRGSLFMAGVGATIGGAPCVSPCTVTLQGGFLSVGPVTNPSSGQNVPVIISNPSPALADANTFYAVPWPGLSVAGYTLSADDAGAIGVTLKIQGANFAPGVALTLPTGFTPSGSISPERNATGTELTVPGVTLPSAVGMHDLALNNPSPTVGTGANLRVSVLGDGTSCAVASSLEGVTSCGAGSESCCTSLAVPGGTFKRNYDGVDFVNAGFPATVSSFRLDKYEVTVGRFRQFANAWAAGWRPSAGAGKHAHLNGGQGLASTAVSFEAGWDPTWATNLGSSMAAWDTKLSCSGSTWTSSAGPNEARPINCVNWYASVAFCNWDGGFLPSEAEWNFAASGGLQQRYYPWSVPSNSTAISSSNAVYSASGSANVGSKGVAGEGRWGQADLGGSVWEWNLDAYAALSTPCTDCFKWSLSGDRVIRGAGYSDGPSGLLSSARLFSRAPLDIGNHVGLRCARAALAQCSGHGNPTPMGGCACALGWGGADCSTCASAYAGATCDFSDASTCKGRGTAQADGTCVCVAGYGGADCGQCANGYTAASGTLPGSGCVAVPTDGTTSIACGVGYTDSNGPASGGACIVHATGGNTAVDCAAGFTDSNGVAALGQCEPIPTTWGVSIKCADGYVDGNGGAMGGRCVALPTDGVTAIPCNSGYIDDNGTASGGICVRAPEPPSCSVPGPGRSTCGTGAESCCTSIEVPGGTFKRNYDGVKSLDDSFPATLSTFRLDKYETTVGRFRKFVDAWVGGWRPLPGDGKHAHLHGGQGLVSTVGGYETGWDGGWAANLGADKDAWDTNLSCTYQDFPLTWTNDAGTNENRPINCVNWFEAYAFCIWDGGFLPSDAEWNYAASGGSQQRYFPWSKPSTSQFIDTTYASYGTGSYTICLGDGVPACSVADIHFVGTKPLGNGYWGHADLAGNLTEWVADWNRSATASMCTDCVGGAEDNERGFRGGEYGASPDALAAAIYGWGNPPDVHTTATGIRCARTP